MCHCILLAPDTQGSPLGSLPLQVVNMLKAEDTLLLCFCGGLAQQLTSIPMHPESTALCIRQLTDLGLFLHLQIPEPHTMQAVATSELTAQYSTE